MVGIAPAAMPAHLLCRVDDATDGALNIGCAAWVHQHHITARALQLCPWGLLRRWLRGTGGGALHRGHVLALRATYVRRSLHSLLV